MVQLTQDTVEDWKKRYENVGLVALEHTWSPEFLKSIPDPRSMGKVHPSVIIEGNVIIGENVYVGPFTLLRGPLYIGNNTSIGPHCEIGSSYIAPHAIIGHHNVILHSYVGRGTHISGFCGTCVVRLDNEPVRIFGREFKKMGAIIMDSCSIGVSTMFMPGSWLTTGTKVIGPATVTKNKILTPTYVVNQ